MGIKLTEPESTTWARKFLKEHKRLPHALDYEKTGYDQGGQCNCGIMFDCCLLDHPKMIESTNKNCYANQLRDFIRIANHAPEIEIK